MATLTIQLTGVCDGGNHLTFAVTGDRSASLHSDIESMTVPVNSGDLEAFVRVAIRMAKAGKTAAQWRSALQTGITVTV